MIMAFNDELSVGMELRLKRTERGASLKEVARVIGISENYLSEIERNKKMPDDKYLLRLAKFYGLNEKDLFQKYGRIPASVQKEIMESDILNETLYDIAVNEKLSDEDKEELYEAIRKLYKSHLG